MPDRPVPRPDSRPVWPFERVDLGVDVDRVRELGLGPDTPPDQLPRLVVTLFYRNRDLRQLELDYGSLEGMQRASAERPAEAIPHTLWLGLRHDPAWEDEERLADLHGSTAWGEAAQVGVARALAAAMGGDPDANEAAVRRSFAEAAADDADAAGLDAADLAGLDDDDELEEPTEGPLEPADDDEVAAG